MVSSVKYMHFNKVCHRDLKPENFLFEAPSTDSLIKLIDFGLSSFFYSKTELKAVKMQTCCGTSFYMAPEVIMGEYTETCDIWSLGIILYILLSGVPPFYSDNEEEIYEAILQCKVDFSDESWNNISAEAKDLITKILSLPDKRISLEDILNHPWMTMSFD